MRMQLLGMALVCAGTLCVAGTGDKAESGTVQQETAVFAKMAATEDAFRTMAARDPQMAVNGFFDNLAKLRWENFTRDFSREQLRDFFLGALIFRGAFSEAGGVTGYYNPWWDAILLTYSRGLPDIPRVREFDFLCGELFRGEAVPEKPEYGSVLPEREPLTVSVMALQEKTRRHFEKLFSGGAAATRLERNPGGRLAANLRTIQARSALRLKMYSMLLHDQARYREAWEMAGFLQNGDGRNFFPVFTTSENRPLIEAFLKLDPLLRQGFVPYGYIPSSEGRLYLFVNGEVPRLFATMSLGGGWRRTIFEWYDLDRAEDFMKIWNSRTEVAK